jgi:hypothetical protein
MMSRLATDILSSIPPLVTSDCRYFAEGTVKVLLCRFRRPLFRLAFRQAPRFFSGKRCGLEPCECLHRRTGRETGKPYGLGQAMQPLALTAAAPVFSIVGS